jgi:hypothetical protein
VEGDGGNFLRLNKGVEREKAIPKVDEGVEGDGGHFLRLNKGVEREGGHT